MLTSFSFLLNTSAWHSQVLRSRIYHMILNQECFISAEGMIFSSQLWRSSLSQPALWQWHYCISLNQHSHLSQLIVSCFFLCWCLIHQLLFFCLKIYSTRWRSSYVCHQQRLRAGDESSNRRDPSKGSCSLIERSLDILDPAHFSGLLQKERVRRIALMKFPYLVLWRRQS